MHKYTQPNQSTSTCEKILEVLKNNTGKIRIDMINSVRYNEFQANIT